VEPIAEPPGWYPDPDPAAPRGRHRYWTGRVWTEHVSMPPSAPEVTPEAAPAAASRRRHPGRWIAALAVLVVVLIAVAGLLVSRSGPSYPKAWDPQVAPIAAKVSQLRGLSFDHPVPVKYLDDAAFKKRVGVDPTKLTPAAKRRIENLSGTLRAFGLINAKTDLAKSFDTVNEAGVLAFYDPSAQEIVIRGRGPLDIERKATLAHELTHVLQDQHFDIQKLRRTASDSDTASSGALTALIEGDAERVKLAYLKELPAADRKAYDAAQEKSGESADQAEAGAAQIVQLELESPYIFGPDVLKVLVAHGGNSAVNDALQQATPTDEIFLNPAAALKRSASVKVPVPTVPKGAHQLGPSDNIGAFDLYTVLASRLDRQVALDAADTWAGDRIVTYKDQGQICVKGTIESRTTDGARQLSDALTMWAAKMPDAEVTSDAARKRSMLTSCATSAITAPDSSKLEGAVRLLAGRNSLLATLLDQGAPLPLSECVSRRLVKAPIFADNIDRESGFTPSEQNEARDETTALVSQCRRAS
jgi:hypothetical protein